MRRVWIAAVALAVSGWGGAEDMPTLNWMEREKAVRADKNVVMKILRENKTLSYSVPAALTQRTQSPQSDAKADVSGRGTRPACPQCDNILVQGDNLEALRALLPFYAGRVKCIYIDPPYNTGSAFGHYDDNLEHSQWLSMMYLLADEWFNPDFIGVLNDGRMFVIEYKGEHLRTNADTVAKDAIRRLWFRQDGKCLYRGTIYKTDGGLDMKGQLDQLFA